MNKTKKTKKIKKQNSCCNTIKKIKKCVRETDNKVFYFPRLYSREKCEKMIRKKGYKKLGFTARSSCAPYKNCSLRQKGGSKKRKTRKNEKRENKEKNEKRENKEKNEGKEGKETGIAVLHQNPHKINGVVHFIPQNRNHMKITYEIKGLKDGKHGFHIHEYGDLTDGCTSACAHYNPYDKQHGCACSKQRHLGDLGNIESKEKMAKGSLIVPNLSLTRNHSIVGRMIIVHEDEDDCGQYSGKNKKKGVESKKTGNAGKRLACGVIGYKGRAVP